MKNPDKILTEIKSEFEGANEMHGNFNSYHEGYAVILEELEELWDEIKKRNPSRSDMRKEAIQVGAMALKFVNFLDENNR